MARAPRHIPRLLALVTALVRARELPLATLCRALEVSEAELRADIELLSLCGLPPYGPEDLIDIQIVRDRVRLSNEVLKPPPLQLTDEEAAGLRVVLRIAEAQGWPETRALASAIRKLEAALLPERREGGRRLARRLLVAGDGGRGERFLPVIRKAISARTTLDVDYYSDGREEQTRRHIDPWRLVALPRATYVIAWCHRRQTALTFRLDRFLRVRRTGARFDPPGGIAIEDYLGERPTTGGPLVAVTVRFAPEVATLALETYPGATAAAGGGATWKTRVWPNLTFCRQIVAWGGAAEVISPATVREDVRRYARDLAARYGA